jgi:hypothetical protein
VTEVDPSTVDHEDAVTIYVGLAVVLGLVVGLDLLPQPWQLAVVFVVGFGALLIRMRMLRATAWSRTELTWTVFFLATLVPTAWLVHRWPFE